MARKPRLDLAGFHHVINRGVAKSDIFKSSKDKDKFLEILCKACRDYFVNIHDYCLMNNHYHLLIETTSDNLSLFMRQINSNYAIYFNKKYDRSGHLWQGRFKSWYVTNKSYLYTLFKYIEHNPIKAKLSNKVGEYPYTLLATILNKKLNLIPCANDSKLKKEYLDLKEFLNIEFTNKDLERLNQFQKESISIDNNGYFKTKSKTLDEHFKNVNDIKDRDKRVVEALKDGYKQIEIAKFLNLSATAISKIKRKANR